MKQVKLGQSEEADVTLLPCQIQHTGKVDLALFDPAKNEQSLFGRKVVTTHVPLPAEFSGYVLEGRQTSASKNFRELNYLTEESPATKGDQLLQALAYMEMMSKLASA